MDKALNLVMAAGKVLETALTPAGITWITITLLTYGTALTLQRKAGNSPLLHPLVVTALCVGLTLAMLNVPVAAYQRHAGFIHWLLGPATVALAIPMYKQWQKIRSLGWRLIACIGVGGIIAPVLAWAALYVASAPLALQFTILTKSITTPLAIKTAEVIGGVPALAALFVVSTGIVGAVLAPFVFRWFHVSDPESQGLALGTVAHAIGTAKAIQTGEQAAAMASLSLCLNGIMTAVILPLIFGLIRQG